MKLPERYKVVQLGTGTIRVLVFEHGHTDWYILKGNPTSLEEAKEMIEKQKAIYRSIALEEKETVIYEDTKDYDKAYEDRHGDIRYRQMI